MKNFKFTLFQIAVHIGSLIPFIVLVWDYYTNNLTYNPLQEATIRTGKTALTLVILSLACTPINTVFGFKQVIKVRRPLGVYAFFYALLHFYIFIGIDYGFNLTYIWEDLAEKRYILVGLSAFLILIPLAITSTKGWQKRLKRSWTKLHKLVYLAGVLVVIHYIWVVKTDIRQPLVYGGILVILFILRIPAVKNWVIKTKFHSYFSHLKLAV
jgi:sulfoxide reductase heme-binding subunit YedZ